MKYSFSVFQQNANDHTFWIAKSSQLKGCVGQGDTCDEAIRELEENEKEWLETAKEYDIEIPTVEIRKEASFSGKFALRMSPYLHEQVDAIAKEQKVSVNHLICEAVAYYIGKEKHQKLLPDVSVYITSPTNLSQWHANLIKVPQNITGNKPKYELRTLPN